MPQESFTVYVVDDDESVRKALKRLLGSMGYRTVTFESAEDLLDSNVVIDDGCLILDILLPAMTGLELQEMLASRGVKCPVVFITAHDNPHWEKSAREAGALAYLRKPFGEQELLDAIRLAFENRV